MILVTGAAGKTGLAVLRALHARGAAARAFVRRDEQREAVIAAGASDTVVGNLESEPDLERAMSGVEAVYLIVPNVHPREEQIGKAAIVAALRAGVDRIVYHSVLHPQIEAMPHHWRKLRVEEALVQSGLGFTILQPANYMQNLLAYWEGIMDDGVIRLPYSVEARSTPVDLRDVVEVAAMALTEEGHAGATYPLVGPEVLSWVEMAQRVVLALGKQVSAETIAVEEWQRAARAGGMDEERMDALGRMFAYYERHDFVGNARILEAVLGRKARRFEEFLDELVG